MKEKADDRPTRGKVLPFVIPVSPRLKRNRGGRRASRVAPRLVTTSAVLPLDFVLWDEV